jgi:hypothetical protein
LTSATQVRYILNVTYTKNWGAVMSYKTKEFYQDILVTEKIYLATKKGKIVKQDILGKNVIAIWTRKDVAEQYLSKLNVEYDELKTLDIDKFVTYEMDEIFEAQEEVIINPTSNNDGELVEIEACTDELMSDLDNIRIKEFNNTIAKSDSVYGLSSQNKQQFILISDDEHEKPNIMPVWSVKKQAEKVRDEDFEECDIIEVEGEVFADWLDVLRDNDKAVAIDLKPGVIGTVTSAQALSDKLTI